MSQDTVISDRAQRLFKALVEHYLSDGQPVGSRILARDSGLSLSSATVRNVMADLEDLGLIRSPHTSSGRVPTALGYRLFVDTLLTVKSLSHKELERLRIKLDPDVNVDALLTSASSLLSEVTQLAGVVMIPRRERLTLRHVEFLPLSANKILAILVINEREVQNRILHTSRPYSPQELHEVANYLNRECIGSEIEALRDKLLHDMRVAREDMNRIMQNAIDVAGQIFTNEAQGDDFVVSGQTNLMSYAEMSDIERLRQLFDAFNSKRDILHLLDQSLHAQGVQIFIGEESGYQVLDECSVVASPYEVDGEVVGVLGVIGPTRMAYNRIIPIVDVTARLLGSALKPGV